jgi:transposase-like protein
MDAIDDTPQWRYPGGYQWLPHESAITTNPLDQRERVLCTGLPTGGYSLVDYRPPANLFLIFANTLCTEEGMLLFANQYGLLGLTESEGAVMVRLKSDPEAAVGRLLEWTDGNRRGALDTGELLSAWQRQLQDLREAVALWSAAREAGSGDGASLARCVQWPRKNLVYYDSHPDLPIPPPYAQLLGLRPAPRSARVAAAIRDDNTRRSIAVIASAQSNPQWLKLFRVGDCLMPAKYYLQKTVNEHLRNRVSPQLLWNVRRSRPHSLALFFVPLSLIGLMWLQLAQAVNGNQQYRQCLACKTWMLISREAAGNRSSRFSCSNACRMKVYYSRIIQARNLSRQGLSIRQIAGRLAADKQAVRRWIETSARTRRADNRGKVGNI